MDIAWIFKKSDYLCTGFPEVQWVRFELVTCQSSYQHPNRYTMRNSRNTSSQMEMALNIVHKRGNKIMLTKRMEEYYILSDPLLCELDNTTLRDPHLHMDIEM